MASWASLPSEIKLKIMEYDNHKHENYKIFLADFKSIYTKCGYESCSNYIKRDDPSIVRAKSEKRGPFNIYFCCYSCSIEERVNRIRYQSSEPNWTSEMYYYNLMTP